MIKAPVRTLAPAAGLALLVVAAPSARSIASEFGNACAGAQIFTEKDCTCMESKASDSEKANMIAWMTSDKVRAAGGPVDEAAANAGMMAIGRIGPICDEVK